MNVNFKVFWNNPIDMVTEAGTQQLTFEVPLGAIIPNPSGGGDLTNYYTKAETDVVAASKVQQTITNGVTTSAPSENVVYDALLLKQNLPTGYVQGWELGVDPLDNTKFTITIGGGVFTDFTDVFNITPVIRQTTSVMSGISPQFLLTHPASYIAFDINLNIVQSSSPFTNEDRRTLIILGSVIHSNNIVVNVTNEIKAPIVAPTNQLHDFMLAVGALNLGGNIVQPNGANLSINVTAGKLWKMGVSASNYYNPHIVEFPLRSAPTFAYRTQTSVEFPSTNLLDPNYYDVGGVRTLITNNSRWTIQHIYMFQSGMIRIQYGQTVYNSYGDALSALLTEPYTVEPNAADNGILIAHLIIKKTCVNLQQDIIDGIASLHTVEKFGGVSGHTAITKETVTTALGYTPAPTRKFVNQQNINYTLQLSDANNIVRTIGASATDIIVPSSLTVAWTPQDRIEVEWYGAGQPAIVAESGVTIRVAGGGSLTYSSRYETGVLEYIGADEWVLYKDDVGGANGFEWVNITTVGVVNPSYTAFTSTTYPNDTCKIEVARKDGMLWIRGDFYISTSITSTPTKLFEITDSNYKILHQVDSGATYQLVCPLARGTTALTSLFTYVPSRVDSVLDITTSLEFRVASIPTTATPIHIPVTCVGELVIK